MYFRARINNHTTMQTVCRRLVYIPYITTNNLFFLRFIKICFFIQRACNVCHYNLLVLYKKKQMGRMKIKIEKNHDKIPWPQRALCVKLLMMGISTKILFFIFCFYYIFGRSVFGEMIMNIVVESFTPRGSNFVFTYFYSVFLGSSCRIRNT